MTRPRDLSDGRAAGDAVEIPGLKEKSAAYAPGPIPEEIYTGLLLTEWNRFIDSAESASESRVQAFLEQHPSLLPGLHSAAPNWSGRSPYPCAVISQPKLPGMSDRYPDFMWVAVDSSTLYPILIEIETPHKKWFRGKRAELHSDFTHAQGQLAEWRAWFGKGHNKSAFMEYYDIPQELARLRLSPRFVLIHGRRSDYHRDPLRLEVRAELAREGEILMPFDRLSPVMNSRIYSTVRKKRHGYIAKAVPAAWVIFNDGEEYQPVSGWDEVIAGCSEMAQSRKDYLAAELAILRERPNYYVKTLSGGLRVLSPKLL